MNTHEDALSAIRMSESHAKQLSNIAAFSFTLGTFIGFLIAAVFLA